MTGRPLRRAISSSQGTLLVMPLVSMNTPLPFSPNVPVNSIISCSSAKREGIGVPLIPLCCSSVEVAKPIAPASIASPTICFILATSPGVAARFIASSPITFTRTEECPQKEATLGTMPLRCKQSRYSG